MRVYLYSITLYFPILRTQQEKTTSRPIAAVWFPTGAINTGPVAVLESEIGGDIFYEFIYSIYKTKYGK